MRLSWRGRGDEGTRLDFTLDFGPTKRRQWARGSPAGKPSPLPSLYAYPHREDGSGLRRRLRGRGGIQTSQAHGPGRGDGVAAVHVAADAVPVGEDVDEDGEPEVPRLHGGPTH